jgi:23S rRNA (adenine2503-C2)-methyltransferase
MRRVMDLVALQGLTPEALASLLPGATLSEARKVVSAVHRGASLRDPVEQVRRTTLAQVRACGHVPSLEVVDERRSALDPFVKLALRTHDARVIETVRIPLERPGRFTVCVSSQAGCALACRFCATGQLGLERNLETWEIVEQVRLVRETVRRDAPSAGIHGVVFQGMGEPLTNVDRVLRAIEVLSEPSAQAIDARNITVCTAGLPSGIRRLAREAPKVRLGISVHAIDTATRRSLMPIDRSHGLEEVLEATLEHAKVTGRSPMWAVTLFGGVNDSDDHARALARRARQFEAESGKRPRLSIIPYNAVPGAPFVRSPRDEAFRAVLGEFGVPSHLRYSGGSDVGAACGQLAGRAATTPASPQ